MKFQTNHCILYAALSVAFAAAAVPGPEEGTLVATYTLSGDRFFELRHTVSGVSFLSPPALTDSNGFGRELASLSRRPITNHTYVGWIGPGNSARRSPVWTNNHLAYEGIMLPEMKFTSFSATNVGNGLVLCYKEGPMLFGEVVVLNETSGAPRIRTLLRRDGPTNRVLTNAVFATCPDGRMCLRAQDSKGAEFEWRLASNDFIFAGCKTNMTERAIDPYERVILQPQEKWTWLTNRWHVSSKLPNR